MHSPSWKLEHIGVVVRDLDKAIKYYEAMGLGPFTPHLGPVIPGKVVESTVYGKPYDFKLKSVSAPMGETELELVMPIPGKGPLQEDFLKSKGEGVNHICFKVDNLQEEAAIMKKQGFKSVMSRIRTGGPSGIYFDTDKEGGVMIELWQQYCV